MTQLMKEETEHFIQTNSPDGGFLQSEEWRKFQEAVERKTFNVSLPSPPTLLPRGEGELFFWANIIEHELPLVGKYFYIPRGPVTCHPEQSATESKDLIQLDSSRSLSALGGLGMTKLVSLAKKENAGWIRFDAINLQILSLMQKNWRVRQAPHDMQPKEIFVIDITKSKEDLLAEMKSKTRYNIKLAQKHEVKVISCHPELVSGSNKLDSGSEAGMTDGYIDEFLRLIKTTAKRDGITPHPDEYYQKMFETIPAENIKLYVAEYDGKVIAANIVIFYGRVATYLHGASDNEYRNVMAPYLLQWQALLDAKAAGCEKYDLGGVKIPHPQTPSPSGRGWLEESGEGKSSWAGITRFKTGFSSISEPIKFPGSYDIVLNPFRYNLYRILQRIKVLV
ncbi:MAG TPA: peptidoglycan bridge formation glycyltransferase FemA/FemB family protein [Patescibacteria group bacterium]